MFLCTFSKQFYESFCWCYRVLAFSCEVCYPVWLLWLNGNTIMETLKGTVCWVVSRQKIIPYISISASTLQVCTRRCVMGFTRWHRIAMFDACAHISLYEDFFFVYSSLWRPASREPVCILYWTIEPVVFYIARQIYADIAMTRFLFNRDLSIRSWLLLYIFI